MRWCNVRRVRKVLKVGSMTFESGQKIQAVKSLDLALYLRQRRQYHLGDKYRDIHLRNLRFFRGEHLKRKRMGLPPYRIR